jgi:hypothetical protein
VDRLTKVAHCVTVKMTYTRPQLAELYSSRIVYFHGVPNRIKSNMGIQFILKFWERLQKPMDTHSNFSSAIHPQTNGQPERINQSLEDVLEAYPMQYGRS